jgi:hypothetical protein
MDCSFQILASNVKKNVTIESQYRFTILFFLHASNNFKVILGSYFVSLSIYILTIKWQLVKSIKPST